MEIARRLPMGAEVQPGGGVHFRVWAPKRRSVAVVLDGGPEVALAPEGDGFHSGFVAGAAAGSRYKYRLDGGAPLPDMASRYQPEGPHGWSQAVDPGAYRWRTAGWRGCGLRGQVLTEIHIGTFTPEGTFDAAIAKLPLLREVGITVVEVMPVCEFPGRFGWGYDGVQLFAPTRLYGDPDAFRRFVDAAHGLGLGVVLDVVYNHLGPSGNYWREYSDSFFSDKPTEWGEAINFDGPGSGPVREFFLANGRYWVEEYGVDGFRLDATQSIFDDGPSHILAEFGAACRAAAGGREIFIVNENEPQDCRLVRPAPAGRGLDGLWNDDLHRAAVVAMTGRNEAYFSDFAGTPQELVLAVRHGFLYQGQR
ncbi:MAG TPA: alpha-amylase family glycosyl hydrolase, partial [Alphaproteobacteria bacterium]|nr:alpha-amylase family glycosyl hydrolase [Alphaproteobacteria bacterium]